MGNAAGPVGALRPCGADGCFAFAEPRRRISVVRAVPKEALPGPYEELRAKLQGRLHLPGDFAYDAARGLPDSPGLKEGYRETWNHDAIGCPLAVASVHSVEEAQEVVRYAEQFCLPERVYLCVAGGRLSHQCMLDSTLVLDLADLRRVDVDAEARQVRVEGGVLQGQLDSACAPHGLAVTTGHCPRNGIGGLTLQGGHGYLERTFGLLIDNLLSCEVILAGGKLVVASEAENPDLFWALQGGGSNFGVVVSFTFRLHAIPPRLHAGTRVHLPLGKLGLPGREELIAGFCKTFQEGPSEATGLLVLPCGGPVLERLVWVGAPAAGKEFFHKHRQGHPVLDGLRSQAYHGGVQSLSAQSPSGSFYPSGLLMPDLPPEAISAIAEMVAKGKGPNSDSQLWIMPLGGEMSRRPSEAAANPHRSAQFWILIMAGWRISGDERRDRAERERVVNWVRQVKEALLPFTLGHYFSGTSSGDGDGGDHRWAVSPPGRPYPIEGGAVGCYVGFRNIYGENLPRLQAVKVKYDPSNLFRLNDNIAPLGARPPSPA